MFDNNNKVDLFRNLNNETEENGIRQKCNDIEMELERVEVVVPHQNVLKVTEDDGRVPSSRRNIWENTSSEGKLEAIRSVRLLLITENPPICDIIKWGILPILVDCLKYHDQGAVQCEAVRCFNLIAVYGTQEQTLNAVEAGAIPLLIQILSSSDVTVCEEAVWALGNIISNSPTLRDYMIHEGLVHPLLSFVRPFISTNFLQKISCVIVHLCNNKTTPLQSDVIQEIISALFKLLDHTDPGILYNTLTALRILFEKGSQENILIGCDIVFKIMPLLEHDETKIISTALEIVGNVVGECDEEVWNVLNNQTIFYFPALLKYENHKIREQASLVVQNFLGKCRSRRELDTVIKAGVLQGILEVLKNSDFALQKEMVSAICHFTKKCSKSQVIYLMNLNVIPQLCESLSCNDTETIMRILISLEYMLLKGGIFTQDIILVIHKCDGLAKIEKFKTHENDDVQKMASIIADECNKTIDNFRENEEEKENL